MLLEFSVTNFKSIADTQKLSMVASSGTSLRRGRVFETENTLAPHVLKSACILGANGSGKSSVIKALGFFVNFIRDSASSMTEGDAIEVIPYKFDRTLAESPSEFEASFIFEDVFYQYGFVADSEKVWEEWLFAKPNEASSRMRNLFQRQYSEEEQDYVWNINETHVKGERELWRKATRSNALFLSTALQLNSDSLRAPYRWLTTQLRVIPSPDRMSHEFTAAACRDPETRKAVLRFIRSADLDIQDINVTESILEMPKEVEKILNRSSLKKIRESKHLTRRLTTETMHVSREGELVPLRLEEESDGTRVIFALAGPWLDVLENGYTLIVDELHNSLHPVALKHLVSMFHRDKSNPNRAQLIYSTHDASVLSRNVMHRDQIWIIEKERGATHLYPLSDFKVRDAEFAKGYLDGRFGGLPHPKEFDLGEE